MTPKVEMIGSNKTIRHGPDAYPRPGYNGHGTIKLC